MGRTESNGWNQTRWEIREINYIECTMYPEQWVHAIVKVKALEQASLRVNMFLSKLGNLPRPPSTQLYLTHNSVMKVIIPSTC